MGLWKSKWEIHREDMEHYREEARGDRAESDVRWAELREETRDLRADYDREIAETRLFNRELLIRLEKTYAGLGREFTFIHEEMHELKAAVSAQTEAILRLVDRFGGSDGKPPV